MTFSSFYTGLVPHSPAIVHGTEESMEGCSGNEVLGLLQYANAEAILMYNNTNSIAHFLCCTQFPDLSGMRVFYEIK